MRIPKTIHYCWFGEAPLRPLHEHCLATWRDRLPGYEIVVWNDANGPWHLPHAVQLRRFKRWTMLSDYVRLHALLTRGGIYLDTDVEVVAPLDPFLEDACFLGFQQKNVERAAVCNAVVGAVPGHPYIADSIAALQYSLRRHLKPFYGIKVMNLVLYEYGLARYGRQTLRDVTLYEQEIFYPFNSNEPPLAPAALPRESVALHHWCGDWHKRRTLRANLASLEFKLWRLPGAAGSGLRDLLRGPASRPPGFRANWRRAWAHRDHAG